jgi:hypothetical protein
MKRGMSGRGRRGAPPLPRQRAALRVVQLTFLALAVFLAKLAAESWSVYSQPHSSVGPGQVLFLAGGAVMCAAGAAWMGFRTVRGPQPPTLD